MYENMQVPQTAWSKISRSTYLITTITLLTHTMSITYSMMSFKQQSAGFISIIIASLCCYFLSLSHLTIYGISILGIMYLKMLEPYYSRSQIHYIVAISGVIIFPFWKIIHFVGKIFDSFPGRIHASMVFGVALITLVKFFPLSIQNLHAFFVAANSSALTNPLDVIIMTFKNFNILTLFLTIVIIVILFLIRNKLNKFPFIAIIVILGILINWNHKFIDYSDLCKYDGVDCKFYIVKLENMIPPRLEKIILLIPSAAVMTIVILFEQFLYLQQFQRRGKRYYGQGDLGQTQKQSKVLMIANLISGLLGGLPICINMFATYQNFAFNMRSGHKGTKLVGLFQIPVSYAFYSIFRFLYQMIPLFVLFIIIATPAIYFLSNMLSIYKTQLLFITCLATLNVITHPIIALILAAFVSIYDISMLLKATPAQILLQNVEDCGSRKSAALVQVIEKKQNQAAPFISQFAKRIIQIQTDQPSTAGFQAYVLYRFTGAVSYLNYFQHIQQINALIEKYVKKNNIPILLSFRYSQIVDQQSLQQLALYVQRLKTEQKIHIVFTGLHRKLIQQMQKIPFFAQMLRNDEKCMYRLDPAE